MESIRLCEDLETGRACCAQGIKKRMSWLACFQGVREWDPVKKEEWPPSTRGMLVASDKVEKAGQIIIGFVCHML